MSEARLAIDIGGTFTDFMLDAAGRRFSRKVLTTPRAPEGAVLEGTRLILADAGLRHRDLGLVIHGTTLATNALIERKGATTALLVTEGFRDSVEMAYENRFEQYDIFMDRPAPLVPRDLRLPVPERIEARGRVVRPLDEDAVAALLPVLRARGVRSVAIGFMHAYINPAHERRAGEILRRLAPDIAVTLSSDVSPEIREYERWSTAIANAYVQPVMDRYLGLLEGAFREEGVSAPIFLITSAGGLTTVDLARRFPVRLVESGPAGGAILAARLAAQCGLDRLVAFDMGGTTAKICLIDDGEPQHSRSFEVARHYRFLKGSGIPLRIPVIEMVEIGAGGGSIASVDPLSRIQVGPESAGSEPGPACYGRGGTQPTVTDADLEIGRLLPDRFAGGRIRLDAGAAGEAVLRHVGGALGLGRTAAALGIVEVVEENMANAARQHAVERGKELRGRAMVAFGGAAPLHAARLAEKLDIATVLVPAGAGVGSAVGFLLAPIAYELARTRHTVLDDAFDPAPVEALRAAMREEAAAVVRAGLPEAPLAERWTVDMRYVGQGHELTVVIPGAPVTAAAMRAVFVAQYEAQFGRAIPGLHVEATGWALRLSGPEPPVPPLPPSAADRRAEPSAHVEVADPRDGSRMRVALHDRAGLRPGDVVPGPALIVEDETTTYVTPAFTARINPLGHIVLTRSDACHVGPADRGGGGTGADTCPHGLQHLHAGSGRRLGRRLRHRGPDARPGGDGHPGPCELDGPGGGAFPRRLSRPHDAARRFLHHQRPLEGHRPPARLHPRHALLPGRGDGRPLRLHLPRHRCRRPRPGAGGAQRAGGGHLRPDPPFRARRRGGRDAGGPHPRQCARARAGGGRHLLPGRLQRGRLPPPAAHDGGVRHCRSLGARRAYPGPLGGRDAPGDPRAAGRPLRQPHARGRVRGAARPRRDAGDRGRRHRGGLRRHLRALLLRHQRAALLHRGLCELRREVHRRAEGAEQRRDARPDPRDGARRLHPERPAAAARRHAARHRPAPARPRHRLPRPGP
jgi:N-methylhydantoinase A